MHTVQSENKFYLCVTGEMKSMRMKADMVWKWKNIPLKTQHQKYSVLKLVQNDSQSISISIEGIWMGREATLV